jgi:hypothetical protein
VLLGDREVVDVESFLMQLPFVERTSLLIVSILHGDDSEDIASCVFSLVGAATRIAARINDPMIANIAATRLRESADCIENNNNTSRGVLQ